MNKITELIKQNIKTIFDVELQKVKLDLPPNDKLGDYAFACFSLAENLKQNPLEISEKLAKNFVNNNYIKGVKSVGPYLNIFISDEFVLESLKTIASDKNFGKSKIGHGKKILIEFSGPNTNKPQHIGHVRNDILGQSLVNIYKNCDYKVTAVNIINDRGIHIVKSMLAWQEFANGETPKSSGTKGDHLVGKYYVKFGQVYQEEFSQYLSDNKIDTQSLDNLQKKEILEKFNDQSKWMTKARNMLQAWEAGDKDVKKLWETMNSWVYDGYKKTYTDLGIKFDHVDYESETYLLGKDMVEEGLVKGIFHKNEDESIWIDLSGDGLDQKIVMRSDGTSVYLTQDLGTAVKRYKKFNFDKAIYIVGNEQDYHFKVLFLTLKKLGYDWADNLHHLSYGMVNLPDGKIKSREGKTADADDLIVSTITKAEEMMDAARKQIAKDQKTKNHVNRIVGLAALKFFMLSSNPQKNITYIPQESISFDGYTGPFIQYTHARIANIINKSGKKESIKKLSNAAFNNEERILIKNLLDFPHIIENSAISYNPSILTQYLFSVAKLYNNFYQKHPVLKAPNESVKQLRLNISSETKKIIKHGLELLGIEAPDSM